MKYECYKCENIFEEKDIIATTVVKYREYGIVYLCKKCLKEIHKR